MLTNNPLLRQMSNLNKLITPIKISLNSILMMLTLGVLIFFIFKDKSVSYLFNSEAQVYLLIGVTFFSLTVNTRFKNDFLEILNVVFVIFYICRIPFVLSPDVPTGIFEKGVDISQIAWYINVLAFQYLSLVICILVVNPRIPRWHLNNHISEFLFNRILIFSLIVILFNTYLALFVIDMHKEVLSNIPAILKTIFTIKNALIVIILSSFMVEKKLLLKYKYFVILCTVLGIYTITHNGGKSIVLEIILLAYLAKIVLNGPMIFRWRDILITIMATIPTFILFFIGGLTRNHRIKGYSEFGWWGQIKFQALEQLNLSDLIYAISYRIGYFDFFLEVVSNPIYEQYVNFTYYFKAVVDKLSPGFDIFQVAFMSRMIHEVYKLSQCGISVNFNSCPSTSTIMSSNFVTVFGESHIIFGFFSFCLFLPLLLFFKYSLSSIRTSSRLADALFYIFLLYIFYFWLTGMGLDMWVAIMVYDGIFTFSIIGLIWFWNRREEKHKIL
jgi:hypothetical protein